MDARITTAATAASAPAASSPAVIRARRGGGAAGPPASADVERLARSMAACSGVTTPRSSIRRMRASGSTAHLPDQARGLLGAAPSRFDAVQHAAGLGLILAAQAPQALGQRVEALAQGRVAGAQRDRELL